MVVSQNYFDPKLIADLGSLRMRAAYVADGWIAGGYAAKRYGNSINFADHKSYSPGDDSRYIDWKLHARSDRYNVRRFEDESNRHIQFLIDTSGSMQFRGANSSWSKLQCAATVAVSLAMICINAGDAIGHAIFDQQVGVWHEASRSNSGVITLIDSLQASRKSGVALQANAIHQASILLHRRSCVILLSDMLDSLEAMEFAIARLLTDGHQLLILRFLDSEECDFDRGEVATFVDLEDGSEMLIDPFASRDFYRGSFAAHTRRLTELVARFGDANGRCQLLTINTSAPISSQLFQMLDNRFSTK